MTAGPPEVTAIIPTRSGGDRLPAAIEALRRGPEIEILVVLNGADPATVDAAGRIDGVTSLHSAVNRGFGGGVALGAAEAGGRVLLLTHDDAEIEPGAVDALVSALDSHDRLGAVSGAVRTTRDDGSRTTIHGGVVRSDGWTLAVNPPPSDDVIAIDYAGTAMLALRADAFGEVGGMDPGFFPAYFTDVDLAYRLRAARWWVGSTAAASAEHRLGSSTSLPFRTFVSARNHDRFLRRWGHALARRSDIEPDDVDAHQAAAEADRDDALAGSAPLPASSPAVATGDQWFVDRAAEVDQAYREHLAALDGSGGGNGEARL